MTQFTDYYLDERLQRALAAAGFVTPTPIQAAALPVAMGGRDLVGTAQTGTGKTAAFVIPILQRLIAMPREIRKTRAVILAPTRELVEQILAVVRELAAHTNIRAVAVYGGVAMQPQTRALRGGVEIVVACPGRLLDHIKRRNTDLRELEYLVLDEGDRMLDMGFLPPIQEILGYLPPERQTMLFSATFQKSLNAFVEQTLRDPARVEVDTAVPAQTVRHTLYQVKAAAKPAVLTKLLLHLHPESDSVLIFTRTRVTANLVVDHLRAAGMPADVLHSDKTQRARQDTLDQFRGGMYPYLVATDIAARGIDVTSISHVINYDMPDNAEDYLHRIGRTGRMEREGRAISLVTSANVRAVREIERMLGEKIEVAQLEGYDELLRAVIPTARDEKARAGKQHAAAHAPKRPAKPHPPGTAHPRREPSSAAPAEPVQQAERPERARHADAP
ncbi:MAG: DEAD/DEAH box helicase, partial [Armatimonadota bacterium]